MPPFRGPFLGSYLSSSPEADRDRESLDRLPPDALLDLECRLAGGGEGEGGGPRPFARPWGGPLCACQRSSGSSDTLRSLDPRRPGTTPCGGGGGAGPSRCCSWKRSWGGLAGGSPSYRSSRSRLALPPPRSLAPGPNGGPGGGSGPCWGTCNPRLTGPPRGPGPTGAIISSFSISARCNLPRERTNPPPLGGRGGGEGEGESSSSSSSSS
mmetsp:Transcript_14801/g.19408  ORF Transcript_14801/g.19408 Transcript_14801/m.19408 type:complete len:211 (-) Transcript_14801:2303-2935(-)